MCESWTVWETPYKEDESVTVYNVGTPSGCWVADTGHLASAETRKKNAVLLASAPDLMAALEEALRLFGVGTHDANLWECDARYAIAKARGTVAK